MPQKKFTQTNDTKAFLRIREKAAKELIERLKESRDDLNLVVLDGLDAAIVGSTTGSGSPRSSSTGTGWVLTRLKSTASTTSRVHTTVTVVRCLPT